MGAISKAASSYEDNLSKSELKSLFGGVSKRSGRVVTPKTSVYMVSVRNANTATLWSQLFLRFGRFCKQHKFAIVILLAVMGWMFAFSGWLHG